MVRLEKELEWAHMCGLIRGSERSRVLDLVRNHPEELPTQLRWIQSINNLYLASL